MEYIISDNLCRRPCGAMCVWMSFDFFAFANRVIVDLFVQESHHRTTGIQCSLPCDVRVLWVRHVFPFPFIRTVTFHASAFFSPSPISFLLSPLSYIFSLHQALVHIHTHKHTLTHKHSFNVFAYTLPHPHLRSLIQNSRSAAVFFAVCRGKVAEGIDFADECGRAVIVTGIPYPNLQDIRWISCGKLDSYKGVGERGGGWRK